ncbi:MAG: nicotinate (nicotinamide) nucleotide adenylyltransferase, partial [Chloroflexi bacterium]|nr:nicotinate (nicotinamide) nucleotide adenylyltransferase [Chloroflexota bacterium]
MGGAALGGPLTTAWDVAAGRPVVPVRPGSIGILGGTFDPFHLGHLALARAARDRLGLARVLIVPAAAPPHKPNRPISPGEVRLALVEAGIADERRLEASRIELDRSGPSWTVDTLEDLAGQERAAGREPDLTLILSAESFASLPTWREPERVLDLATVAVAPRSGHEPPDPAWIRTAFPGRESRIVIIEGPQVGVSASDIRRRAAAGEPLDGLVPPAVAEVIATDRLYRHSEPREDESIVTEPVLGAGTPADEPSATATAARPDG